MRWRCLGRPRRGVARLVAVVAMAGFLVAFLIVLGNSGSKDRRGQPDHAVAHHDEHHRLYQHVDVEVRSTGTPTQSSPVTPWGANRDQDGSERRHARGTQPRALTRRALVAGQRLKTEVVTGAPRIRTRLLSASARGWRSRSACPEPPPPRPPQRPALTSTAANRDRRKGTGRCCSRSTRTPAARSPAPPS